MSTTARSMSLKPAIPVLLSKFCLLCLQILDHVLLLQMGRIYLVRFRGFAEAAEIEGLQVVDRWRVEQQEEWNRLSTTVICVLKRVTIDLALMLHIKSMSVQLAFLATMSAAILTISPPAPSLAFSVWLGAAGLSACGLFIVQYFPIQAFSISDKDMVSLVRDGNYISSALLAIAVASPVIITLWSSILFAIGITDYIIQNTRDKPRFMLLSLVPVTIGFMASATVMIIGSIIGQRIEAHNKTGPLQTRWRKFSPNDKNNCTEIPGDLTQTSVGARAPVEPPKVNCTTVIQSVNNA